MSFLKNIFGKKEEPINSYQDFWDWFEANENKFHKVVKNNGNIEKEFFAKISPKLNELREGILFLTGMLNDETADLIFTADGNIKNFYFIEEMIEASPNLKGWKFRAHKPPVDLKNQNIEMGNYNFGSQNINFYSNVTDQYPDEISITLVHDDFTEENKTEIINGCYIFLDNFIGELNLSTTVDNIGFIEKDKATTELVPIKKLKDFLIWREKEFIEKYDGLRRDTKNDNYSGLEAKLENGNALVAIINSDLLEWDSKASHPWVLSVEIKYDGERNGGMPDNDTYQFLDTIEKNILEELKDFEGYLNVGRQTANSLREIYFACKEFRKPSKVMDQLIPKYSRKITINYEIYKDKYWQSFERFQA